MKPTLLAAFKAARLNEISRNGRRLVMVLTLPGILAPLVGTCYWVRVRQEGTLVPFQTKKVAAQLPKLRPVQLPASSELRAVRLDGIHRKARKGRKDFLSFFAFFAPFAVF